MSEPFIGEIRIFGFHFAPRGWANANGELMPVSQNDALFSLYGTIYGGDGRTTFGLPDLRGRMPMNYGESPGLTSRPLGARGGSEFSTLSSNNMPGHSHSVQIPVNTGGGNSANPENRYLAEKSEDVTGFADAPTDGKFLGTHSTAQSGAGQAFSNMPPFQAVNYCCALVGVYPSRS